MWPKCFFARHGISNNRRAKNEKRGLVRKKTLLRKFNISQHADKYHFINKIYPYP